MYLDKDLKNEKDKMKTIITAMTHQYKQMQKEYGDELTSLAKKIEEREQDLSNSLLMFREKRGSYFPDEKIAGGSYQEQVNRNQRT